MKRNKVITLLVLSAAGVTLLAACSNSNKSTTAGQEKRPQSMWQSLDHQILTSIRRMGS